MNQKLCQFGVELPCYVADIFLNKPDRFFSLRMMPEGTEISRQPHDADTMARRLKELARERMEF